MFFSQKDEGYQDILGSRDLGHMVQRVGLLEKGTSGIKDSIFKSVPLQFQSDNYQRRLGWSPCQEGMFSGEREIPLFRRIHYSLDSPPDPDSP